MSNLRTAVYLSGLAAFYLKYVPLAAPFQAILAPILLFTAALAWRDPRRGTLFFVFAFPLISNLPYFFGIHEPFFCAPTALVLFLAYFLGVQLNRGRQRGGGGEGTADAWGSALTQAIAFWAMLVAVSAAITFFRYSNFFPLHGGTIYEIKTNTYGVSAGGALQSVIFNALNYLTGIAFFWALSRTLRSEKDADDALTMLGGGTLLVMAFALVQHFGRLTLGNNPASYTTGLINGTFKDALSFGAYLSMIAPLFLGAFFAASDKRRKIAALAIVMLAAFLVLYSGSKIALGSLLLTSAALAAWRGAEEVRAKGKEKGGRAGRPGKPFWRKETIAAGVLIAAAVVAGAAVFGKPILARLGGAPGVKRLKDTSYMINWRIRSQWDPGLKMLRDYPLTGIGLGAYIIETANYTKFFKESESIPESAENVLLQAVTELGAAGLAALIWIGWAIARRLRGNFRRRPDAGKAGAGSGAGGRGRRFVARGAALGVLAFAIDGQMHSFIGSYEIKYTLWLLIGLLFAMSRGAEGSGGAERAGGPAESGPAASAGVRSLRHSRKLVLAAALLAFGAVQLWNSTHSLALRARTESLGLVQDFGLSPVERSSDGREFRWTREYGAIPIKPGEAGLEVAVQAAHPDIAKRPVKVKFILVTGLFASSRLLKEIELADNGWKSVALDVGAGREKSALLLVKVDRTWNPKKVLGTADPRNLGVAVAVTGGL